MLYVSKREQERSSDALDKKGIANVAIAVPPTTPLLPAHSPWLVMFLGAFLAAFLGLSGALVAEHFDSSFRTPEMSGGIAAHSSHRLGPEEGCVRKAIASQFPSAPI